MMGIERMDLPLDRFATDAIGVPSDGVFRHPTP
jgi:hypothetical protein